MINANKCRCKTCRSTFFYFDDEKIDIRCRRCKTINEIKISDIAKKEVYKKST